MIFRMSVFLDYFFSIVCVAPAAEVESLAEQMAKVKSGVCQDTNRAN